MEKQGKKHTNILTRKIWGGVMNALVTGQLSFGFSDIR